MAGAHRTQSRDRSTAIERRAGTRGGIGAGPRRGREPRNARGRQRAAAHRQASARSAAGRSTDADRAGVLPGSHAVGTGGAVSAAARNGQDPHSYRHDRAARAAFSIGRTPMNDTDVIEFDEAVALALAEAAAADGPAPAPDLRRRV